jgi:hypothetical protein
MGRAGAFPVLRATVSANPVPVAARDLHSTDGRRLRRAGQGGPAPSLGRPCPAAPAAAHARPGTAGAPAPGHWSRWPLRLEVAGPL